MRSACALFICFLAVSSLSLASAAEERGLSSGGAGGYAEKRQLSSGAAASYADIEDLSFPKIEFSAPGFLSFVKGVLQGVGISESWTQLEPCIQSNDDAIENVQKAIQYFQNETDTMNIIMGLAAIGKALTDLPASAQSCGASAKDIQKLAKSLAAINRSKDFGWRVSKNLILNILDFPPLVSNAIYYYKDGKYDVFGMNIGQIIGELLFVDIQILKTSSKDIPDVDIQIQALDLPKFNLKEKFNATTYKLFIKGYIRGVGATANWTQLAPCFNSNKHAIENLNYAMTFFVQKDILMGLAAIGHSLMDLPTVVQSCGTTGKDLGSVFKSLAAINGTRGFASRIIKNLIINSLDIYLSLSKAMTEYDAGNWEEFGFNFGALLDEIVLADIQLNEAALKQNLLTIANENKLPQEFLAY